MTEPQPRLLIAEDEPLLAAGLARSLAKAWPQARIVGSAGDGLSAVQLALQEQPDVCFLDIRMPGQSGLEAARALAEDWPDGSGPIPLLVFVTAFDQHALAAFEASAVDYLLKPVQEARLAQTVQRLQERLAARRAMIIDPGSSESPRLAERPRDDSDGFPASQEGAGGLSSDLSGLARLLRQMGLGIGPVPSSPSGSVEPWIRVISAGAGSAVYMVPVDEVLLFEAADKYVRVLTARGEHLIRTPLKELLPRLDPQVFWQVHRGSVVRADAIEKALRDETGRVSLVVRGLNERPVVSRLHSSRFRPM